jgi:tetratricopeptide (TPR) repeat protein
MQYCQTTRGLVAAIFLVALPFLSNLDAQTASERFKAAEDLFLRNNTAQAVTALERIVLEDAANIDAALYLGIAYQQLERWDDSIDIFRRVLPRSGDKQALFAYNLGNAYFAKGAASFAEQYYTRAIQSDAGFVSAYLNRANARVKTGKLTEAIEDYRSYLELLPDSSKRSDIERIIDAIRQSFVLAEQEKSAREQAAREEEARKQQLLQEVSASLQAASENTKGLSAGADEMESYEGEFELE